MSRRPALMSENGESLSSAKTGSAPAADRTQKRMRLLREQVRWRSATSRHTFLPLLPQQTTNGFTAECNKARDPTLDAPTSAKQATTKRSNVHCHRLCRVVSEGLTRVNILTDATRELEWQRYWPRPI
mmetsp:Transcript_48324/g.96078  ORF Transcript_48324/g.96078 Transcript_48324/m.96078 type:complete len:128 (-) Transcript_48324:2-385(-)